MEKNFEEKKEEAVRNLEELAGYLFTKENLIISFTADEEGFSQMEKELREMLTLKGKPFRLLPLPMPNKIVDEEGLRLPATYANFLIGNGFVLVPTYNHKETDEEALATIGKAFPDRRIISIDCRALIKQHGSLHCVTMQLPQNTLNIDE